ncbi:MlaD family protein [Silvimonas sp. JCM 19000]
MTHPRVYFRLGLFVLVAVLTASVLLVAFGAGRWFRPSVTLESYFDESVQGLDLGSKVRYRGVTVGQVSKISFTYNKYEQDLPPIQRQQYVLVEMKLRPELFGGKAMQFPSQDNLTHEIVRGLRVRLTPQGLTGTSYMEIDYFDPARNPPLPLNWTPQALYIPSAHGSISQLMDATQDVVTRLQKLDLETTVQRLNHLLGTLDDQVGSLNVGQIGKSLQSVTDKLDRIPTERIASDSQTLINELRNTNQQLSAMLSDPRVASAPANLAISAERLRQLLDKPELASSLEHLDATLRRLDRLSAGKEGELADTLSNLHAASDDLRDLLARAKAQPSSLLFSSPPTPYPLPR